MYWDAFITTAILFGLAGGLVIAVVAAFMFGNMFCRYMERLFDDNIFLWLAIMGTILFAVLYLFVLGALASGASSTPRAPPDPNHKVQAEK